MDFSDFEDLFFGRVFFIPIVPGSNLFTPTLSPIRRQAWVALRSKTSPIGRHSCIGNIRLGMIAGLKDLENRAKDVGMTRLARDLNLSRGFLYKIFDGTGSPTVSTLEKLARALGFQIVLEPVSRRPRREDVLMLLSSHEAELREAGIKTLALFGSVARDEAREDSDIDLMIEIDGPKSLRNMGRADRAIARVLPFKVDVVYRSSFKPEILANAEKDAVYVIGQKP